MLKPDEREDKTLEREVPEQPEDNSNNYIVRAASKMYREARELRYEQEAAWELITKKYEKGFEVKLQGKTIHVNSKLLFQAHQKIIKKAKIPTAKYLSDGMTDLERELTRDGVNTIKNRGGLVNVMQSNWGSFHKFLLLGDAFIMLGAGDKDQPVVYKNSSLMNVYVDPYASSMNNSTDEQTVQEILIIFDKDYDEAVIEADNNGWDTSFGLGGLPNNESEFDSRFDMQEGQQDQQRERRTQFGHYYNIKAEEPIYIIYAGETAKIIAKFEGKDYPFWDNGKPYIPVVNFNCYPSGKGFYSYGIGHLLYDLSCVQERMDNLAYNHVEENVNPPILLTVDGKASAFLNQYQQVKQAQAMGHKGFMINERNQSGKSTSDGKFATLNTEPLTNEYERIEAKIIKEIKRCGFPIDEIDVPISQTATATISESTTATEYVQQIQEQNRHAYIDLEQYTIAIMRDTMTQKSKIPVITKAKLNEKDDVKDFVMGDVIELLQAHEVVIDVNSRNGVYKTDAERKLDLNEGLQIAAGTRASPGVRAEAMRIRGFNINKEDLEQEQQEQLNQEQNGIEQPRLGQNAQGVAA